jgi:two-component system sensor histidine kinase DevS
MELGAIVARYNDEVRFSRNITPMFVISIAMLIGLAVSIGVSLIAIETSWLGLSLAPGADGHIAVRNARGPSSAIPVRTTLVSIASESRNIELKPLDLTIEPDGAMGNYETYRCFLERQDELAAIQNSGNVIFTAADGNTYSVTPARLRPPTTLPVEFWVQVFVGLFAWLISSAVFAFRPNEPSARYPLLSGGETLVFAPCAAVYSTRELALPTTLFQWLNDLNFLGGILFAASLFSLLLFYPRKIAPRWTGLAVVAVFVSWFALQEFGVFDSMTFARRFLVMIAILGTFALAGVHWFLTRRDPAGRAMLQWFLLPWMLGPCLFGLFILLPQMFGVDTSNLQGYAFLLFLLVYAGLAFGILRFRLFGLGEWWGRIVAWSLTVLLLIMLDILFLTVLQFSSNVSLSLALVVSGLAWIPIRSFLWNRFLTREPMTREALFGQVVDVALTANSDRQSENWKDFLQKVFDPLKIQTEPIVETIATDRDGLVLLMPEIYDIPALRLEFPYGGRRLFTPRDLALAGELRTMLKHALESRLSYEKSVETERRRIARDMHDNIGAQLLSALHSQTTDRKDTMIRETLSDLRDIINNASGLGVSLDTMLADLRIETAERLSAAGISIDWRTDAENAPIPTPQDIHVLRSIVREPISNIIKHSGATNVGLVLRYENGSISLYIGDDGRGFDQILVASGNGLKNMQAHIHDLQGRLEIFHDGGTKIRAVFPFCGAKGAS